MAAVESCGELTDIFMEDVFTVEDPTPNLHEGALYSLGLDVEDRKVRGKRVRPALCLMIAEALGATRFAALPFAAAIEILHNFALVHDDIEDGDTMRRGRPSTWKVYGLAHGINTGDYMLAKVFQVILRDDRNPIETREQLLILLEKTLEELFAGQAMDISARSAHQFTVEEYNLLVSRKTGSYLAAPMLGGAIIAGAKPAVLHALDRLGHDLGPLFQVRDDLIDLTTGKGRGEIGNDIREGKRSYLVALASDRCGAGDRERLFSILDKPREATTADDVAWCVDLFRRVGAIDAAETRCRNLRDSALATVASLEQPLRGLLETTIRVMADRQT
ncbi:polyprenyl synthetase family protein [bacterium]|nr:polyprenyl synthetase family protein [bacterium]